MAVVLSPQARQALGNALMDASDPTIRPPGHDATDDEIAEACFHLQGYSLAVNATEITIQVYDETGPRKRRPPGVIVDETSLPLQRGTARAADAYVDEGLALIAQAYLEAYGMPTIGTTWISIDSPFIVEAI